MEEEEKKKDEHRNLISVFLSGKEFQKNLIQEPDSSYRSVSMIVKKFKELWVPQKQEIMGKYSNVIDFIYEKIESIIFINSG